MGLRPEEITELARFPRCAFDAFGRCGIKLLNVFGFFERLAMYDRLRPPIYPRRWGSGEALAGYGSTTET